MPNCGSFVAKNGLLNPYFLAFKAVFSRPKRSFHLYILQGKMTHIEFGLNEVKL